MCDGLFGDVWYRNDRFQALAERNFVARIECHRGLADFLESLSSRVGDPFGSTGGWLHEEVKPTFPMQKYPLLEICVENLDAAVAAERGGADRIELCENLAVGGLTPSTELMSSVRRAVNIPIFAMIRPRGGDFVYSALEFEQMVRDLASAKACDVDGVVFGLLQTNCCVDLPRTKELVELAGPLPVTFHRAFDEAPDLRAALGDVIASGAARILTSGGKSSAERGTAAISELVKWAGEEIGILAGGGINAENLRRVVQDTGAREFHSGLSSTVPYPRTNDAVFETEVRRLAEVLKNPTPTANSVSKRA